MITTEMQDCAVPDCARQVPAGPPFCRADWRRVPPALRRELARLWRHARHSKYRVSVRYIAAIREAVGAVARVKAGPRRALPMADPAVALEFVAGHAGFRQGEWAYVRTLDRGRLLVAWRTTERRAPRPGLLHELVVTAEHRSPEPGELYRIRQALPEHLVEIERTELPRKRALRIRLAHRTPALAAAEPLLTMEAV